MTGATLTHDEGRTKVEKRGSERLLVPIDFTAASMGAMRYAAAIAERCRMRSIRAVHVFVADGIHGGAVGVLFGF